MYRKLYHVLDEAANRMNEKPRQRGTYLAELMDPRKLEACILRKQIQLLPLDIDTYANSKTAENHH